ncbi:MAG: T9SS type A sorting domain-containing protein [Flavobacteriales bacterium]
MKRIYTSIMGLALLALGAQAQSPNIVGYEYWFDQNDAARVFVPATPAPNITLTNAPFNTNGLSLGQHVSHLRLKDKQGNVVRWSSVVTRGLQVGQPGPWEIVAVRYWIGSPANDTDPLIRYKYFDLPQTEIAYSGLLDLCGYTAGSQTLKLQLLDNHGQWSSVMSKPVTVNPAGVLGEPAISASSNTFCPGDVITFTATPQSGTGVATPTGYDWQVPTGNGWSAEPSNGNELVVTIGTVSGTVQAAATNYCGIGATASYAVNIPTTPAQPGTIGGPLQACVGSNAAYTIPQVPGVTYVWANNAGWPMDPLGATVQTTIGSANATITVTPFNACGVAGPPRTAQIVVTDPPNAGEDGMLAICSNGLPTDLFMQLQGTPNAGGVWRTNGVIVSGIYNPAIDSPGVYTYTVVGTGPCADASANVVVTEPQMPNAGTNTTVALCSNNAPVLMTMLLDGAPNPTGSWSGPSPTDGFYDPNTMTPGIYTYVVTGIAPCPDANSTLIINEDTAPNAGNDGTLELCYDSPPTSLISYLGGNPDVNGIWSGPGGTFPGIFFPSLDAEGPYIYSVPGVGTCDNDSATLVVNVMDLGLSGIDGLTDVPDVVPLTYTALPALADADSILWTLPPGWEWAPDDVDHFDAIALVIPPAQAMTDSLCVQAFGGGCTGNLVCFVVDVTVGVADAEDDGTGVLVYPNPNNGRFTVRASVTPDQMTFRLVNAIGQELAEFGIGTGVVNVDLVGLAAGMYTLRWTSRSRTGSRTLIVLY